MSQAVLGIDVSKDKLDVVLLQGEGRQQQQVANSASGHVRLVGWLRRAGVEELHACLEATGQYGEGVAEYLYAQGYQVSVVNPARIKAYGDSKLRHSKNDKADAALIATFCQRERPTLWAPAEESVRELQALVRHLEDLKNGRQQQRNRLQSGGRSARVHADLAALVALLDQQIKEVSKEIREHIKRHTDLKRQHQLLKSIPGIGSLTAAVLLGEVRDIRSFLSARQLAAYAGLVPRQHESGSSVHKKPRLSKRGNAQQRGDGIPPLYFPAIVAMQHNPLMRALRERMAKTGHSKMAIIGAIMRKLLHLAYGVLKTGKPFDPNHAQTAMA
jgi:transposase